VFTSSIAIILTTADHGFRRFFNPKFFLASFRPSPNSRGILVENRCSTLIIQ
jgi:hypothetical protein